MTVRFRGCKNFISVSFSVRAEDYPKIAQEILDFERKINEKIKEFAV